MPISDEDLRQKFAAATPEQAARMICRAAARARGQDPVEDPDDPGENQTPNVPDKKKKKYYDSDGNEVDPFADDEEDDKQAKTKAFAVAVIRAGQKRRGEIV